LHLFFCLGSLGRWGARKSGGLDCPSDSSFVLSGLLYTSRISSTCLSQYFGSLSPSMLVITPACPIFRASTSGNVISGERMAWSLYPIPTTPLYACHLPSIRGLFLSILWEHTAISFTQYPHRAAGSGRRVPFSLCVRTTTHVEMADLGGAIYPRISKGRCINLARGSPLESKVMSDREADSCVGGSILRPLTVRFFVSQRSGAAMQVDIGASFKQIPVASSRSLVGGRPSGPSPHRRRAL
jgi:hypothetical protein